MTRHEKLLAETILGEIRNSAPEEAVAHLFAAGLIDRRSCEQRAVYAEVVRLSREGMPRCEAMLRTAETFCCSYEKVRGMYYNQSKSRFT